MIQEFRLSQVFLERPAERLLLVADAHIRHLLPNLVGGFRHVLGRTVQNSKNYGNRSAKTAQMFVPARLQKLVGECFLLFRWEIWRGCFFGPTK